MSDKGSDLFYVRIIKTPDGPAPEWVRKQWVEVMLPARKYAANTPEVNFVTDVLVPGRGGIIVDKKIALERLGDMSVAAEGWFKKHLGENLRNFVFGPDEYEILPENPYCEEHSCYKEEHSMAGHTYFVCKKCP